MAPHHGKPQSICRNSIQVCTSPTGDHPPKPNEANVGSAPAANCTISSTGVVGIGGASGIFSNNEETGAL